MFTFNEGKYVVESFDSMHEFINMAQSNPNPQSSDGNSESFAGTASLKDACTLAHNGWTEVRPDVELLFNDLEARIADKISDKFLTYNDVAGSEIDMGMYVSGVPEHMISFSPVLEATMGRVIKIHISITASASIPKEQIMARGVAVCALVDTIHKLGVGVEIWGEDAIVGQNSKLFGTRVLIHDSSEMLDIDNVMFALAHPSMLRRLTFSIQEQSPNAKAQGVGGGYGTPTDLSPMEADVKIERLQRGTGDIIAKPVEWVISTVTGLGLIESED